MAPPVPWELLFTTVDWLISIIELSLYIPPPDTEAVLFEIVELVIFKSDSAE